VRTRHPFPTLELGEVGGLDEALSQVNLDPVNDTPSELPIGFVPHRGENRKQRRAGAATFVPHADLPERDGLRRRLWTQRKRNRTPKMRKAKR
jgi:hypothetical protein